MPERLNIFGSCHFDKFKFLSATLTASNLFFQLIQIASSTNLPFLSPWLPHCTPLSSFSNCPCLNNSIQKVLECLQAHWACTSCLSTQGLASLPTLSSLCRPLHLLTHILFSSFCLLPFEEHFHLKSCIPCSQLLSQIQPHLY